MANYPYRMQLVVDPDNPRNVVAAGSVSIYDSEDTGKTTLLTLTDPSGVPIPNPITSNANGFTPPFVTTSPEVLWVSGEFTDYFQSYKGMRDEAVAAVAAAEEAGANAATEAAAGVASVVADADAAKTAAEAAAAAAANSAALVAAPADTAIAAAINGSGTATKAALSATILDQITTEGVEVFAPPTSALQDFLGRIRMGANDPSLLILSDSTSVQTNAWGRLLSARLAALFPTHTISTRFWNATTYDAATTIAGTGTKTIRVWVGGVAGQTWTYPLQSSRVAAMVTATAPDAVIFSYGHNENQAGTDQLLRDRAVATIEAVRSLVPSAAVLIGSQNPIPAYPGRSERRADIYRRIAMERGYGYLPVTEAFYADGRDIATVLVQGDGIHPTDAGSVVWVDEVVKAFRTQQQSQPIPVQAPAFTVGARSLILNSDFSGFASPPTLDGWTATNCTLAKDTTASRLESKPYVVSMTKSAAGASSKIAQSLTTSTGSRLIAGREVTFAVRMFIPTGASTAAGQISVVDGVGASQPSDTWQGFRDQWFWNIVTARIAATATTVTFNILSDPSSGSALDTIYVDRAVVVLGRYPRDVY